MGRTAGSTAEETRGRILRAARELFTERGYGGTSIRDIADQLGMTKAALYYHFPAKQDLLDALIAPTLERIDAVARTVARQDPVDREWALREIAALYTGSDIPFGVLFSDPSAFHEVATRLDALGRLNRLTLALASGEDPVALLAVRCALGALKSGLVEFRMERAGFRPCGGAPRESFPAAGVGELSSEEIDLIVDAALRAWSVQDRVAEAQPAPVGPSEATASGEGAVLRGGGAGDDGARTRGKARVAARAAANG